MSVTSWEEIAEGRSGSAEADSKGVIVRKYTRRWRVTTSSASDNAATLLTSGYCPAAFSAYPGDTRATLRSVECSQEAGKLIWIATGQYSTQDEQEQPRNENPLADPAIITVQSQQYTKVFEKDTAGHAIVNSAGDKFSDPPEGDDSRWVYHIEKNVSNIPTWFASYPDAVNSGPVTIGAITYAAKKLKLMGVNIGKWEQRNGIWFRVLALDIAVNDDTWPLSVLDQGFREKDGAGGRKKIWNETDGTEVTSPALLDGSGAHIADPESSDGVFLDFDIYKAKDFSVLPLT